MVKLCCKICVFYAFMDWMKFVFTGLVMLAVACMLAF